MQTHISDSMVYKHNDAFHEIAKDIQIGEVLHFGLIIAQINLFVTFATMCIL